MCPNRTVLRWVQAFGPLLAAEARRHRRPLGRCWYTDEMFFFRGKDKWYLYRAVDEHGQVVDALLRDQRDTASAEALFEQALPVHAKRPARSSLTTISRTSRPSRESGTDGRARAQRTTPCQRSDDDQGDRAESCTGAGPSTLLAWAEDTAHGPTLSGRLRVFARFAWRAYPIGRPIADVLDSDHLANIRRSMSTVERTPQWVNRAAAPASRNWRVVSSPSASLISPTTIRAPSRPKSKAAARPMPVAAPRTTAVLSLSRIVNSRISCSPAGPIANTWRYEQGESPHWGCCLEHCG
jgi:hypothetical protein